MSSQKITHSYSDDTRLALLEQSINNINDTLIRFEKRFDKLDNEFKVINNEFKGINNEFKSIRAEMRSDFRWLLTIISGSTIGLFGILAHGFKWF